MSLLNLTIDDLGARGDGIAHHEGATIFVAGALAGEKVSVEMTGKDRAEIVKILEPSSCRAAPSCPHFGRCGGCLLQHLGPEAYAEFKTTQLRLTLERAGIPVPSFEPIFVTPPQTRRRARLAAQRRKDEIIVGFNELHKHTIIDLEHCAILCPPLMNLIPKIREHLAIWLPRNTECDIQVTVLDDGIDMMLIGGPKLDLRVREKLGDLAQKLNIAKLSWRQTDFSEIEPISFAAPVHVTFGKIGMPFPSDSFLQASPLGEKALIDFARSHIKAGLRVLDLFCGLGTFGLSLEKPKNLLFSDIDGPATTTLEHALKSTSRAAVERRNLNKEPFSASECNDFDCVIFDPPRIGAKAQSQEIADSNVPLVLAISCNPQSFTRDAKILINGGYKLTALQPVDQFLWSNHIELAAKFEK